MSALYLMIGKYVISSMEAGLSIDREMRTVKQGSDLVDGCKIF